MDSYRTLLNLDNHQLSVTIFFCLPCAPSNADPVTLVMSCFKLSCDGSYDQRATALVHIVLQLAQWGMPKTLRPPAGCDNPLCLPCAPANSNSVAMVMSCFETSCGGFHDQRATTLVHIQRAQWGMLKTLTTTSWV